MELAAFIGVPFSEFWDMTPSELNLAAKGFARRNEMEQKQSIYQAYLISRWVWAKRINIKKILEDPKKEKKQMSDDEMLKQVRILNKLFGGTEKGVSK